MDNNNNNRSDENREDSKKGFGYWWHNVFMYHYFKYALGGLVLVILILVLTLDATSKETYDFGIVVAAGYGINGDDLRPFIDYVADQVGDLNGDGVVNVDFMNINLNTTDALNQVSRWELTLNDDAFVLFILDEQRSRTIGDRGDFDDLAELGFDVDPDAPYRVYAADCKALSTLPIPDEDIIRSGSYRFTQVEYICLQTWKVEGKSKLGDLQSAAAVRLLRTILEDRE